LLLALVPLDNADLLRMGRRPPEDFIETELRSIAQTHAAADSVNPAAVTRALQELETLVMGFPETEPVAEPPPSPAATPEDEYLRDLMTSLLGESTSDEKLPKPAKPSVRESKSGSAPPSREPVLEDDEDEWEEPLAVPRRWFARSPADFLEEARALLDKGEPEKAMQRLDRVAAQDLRYPGLWDLAAEAFERMGEPEMAAKCRRRAQESTR